MIVILGFGENEKPKENKTGNVRITWHGGAFVQTLLQQNSKKYYMLECVFVVIGI